MIIAMLFWLAHRRWKPMLWLLTLLALILGGTLALGGLILSGINVVSMGFAAILLGLAVDYAVVNYQEALSYPLLSVPQIRRNRAQHFLGGGDYDLGVSLAQFRRVARFGATGFAGRHRSGALRLGDDYGIFATPFPERMEQSPVNSSKNVPPGPTAGQRELITHHSPLITSTIAALNPLTRCWFSAPLGCWFYFARSPCLSVGLKWMPAPTPWNHAIAPLTPRSRPSKRMWPKVLAAMARARCANRCGQTATCFQT